MLIPCTTKSCRNITSRGICPVCEGVRAGAFREVLDEFAAQEDTSNGPATKLFELFEIVRKKMKEGKRDGNL